MNIPIVTCVSCGARLGYACMTRFGAKTTDHVARTTVFNPAKAKAKA